MFINQLHNIIKEPVYEFNARFLRSGLLVSAVTPCRHDIKPVCFATANITYKTIHLEQGNEVISGL
jgi:hypothetical protein